MLLANLKSWTGYSEWQRKKGVNLQQLPFRVTCPLISIATDISFLRVLNLQSISHFNDSLDVNGHENGPNKCSKMFPCVNWRMAE